jgi:hypothetical protein
MTFEELKNKIDLQAFLAWQGFKKDESKSTARQLVYNGPGDEKVVLLHHRTSGELIYQNLRDSADRGNVINFVANRLDGYVNTAPKSKQDYIKVSEELKKYLNIPLEQRSSLVKEKIEEQKKYYFNYKLFNPKPFTDAEYLESRGILKETYDSPQFKGTIVNCQQYDFVRKENIPGTMAGFIITNGNNKIEGLDMRGPGVRTFALGSNKSESFWTSAAGEGQTSMVITESPIDALSYHQIKGNGTNRYYSTNGNMTEYQVNHIKENIDKRKYEKAILATDNDIAGYRFDLKILSVFLKDKIKFIGTKKDQTEIEVNYPVGRMERDVMESPEQYRDTVNGIIKSFGLEKTIQLDKAPEAKDWNQTINPLEKKKKDMSNQELTTDQTGKQEVKNNKGQSQGNNFNDDSTKPTKEVDSNKSNDLIPLEVKNILLTKEQREGLAEGKHIYLKGMFDQESGRKRDGYVQMEEMGGTKKLSISFAEKELVIEDKIMNYKLSNEEKARLHKGETLGPLKLDKAFTAFLQVDKNRNRVVVKSETEMGIPQKIGGYELNDQDKHRLANNEQMPPRIYKGKHGYFMATVKLTEDKKGLEYSGIVGLTEEEALKRMPVINNPQDKTISNVMDVSKGVFEQEQQRARSAEMPSNGHPDDKNRLEVLAKSNNGPFDIDQMFEGKNKDKDAFLNRYDLYDKYTRHNELTNSYASYTDNASRKNVTLEMDGIAKEIKGIAKEGLSKMDKGTVASVETKQDLSKIAQPDQAKPKGQSMTI